jgi:hypothetical protein
MNGMNFRFQGKFFFNGSMNPLDMRRVIEQALGMLTHVHGVEIENFTVIDPEDPGAPGHRINLPKNLNLGTIGADYGKGGDTVQINIGATIEGYNGPSPYVSAMADQVKVFQMGDCDWTAGRSAEEVTAYYTGEMGCDMEGDAALEITAEQMNSLIFHDQDVDPSVRRTFKEQLDKMIADGVNFPAFFATTEF